VKVVSTVVIMEVIRLCDDEYVKNTKPMEKHATAITRKTSGDRLIQMRTHQGTFIALINSTYPL